MENFVHFKGTLIRHADKKSPWLFFLHGFPDDSEVWKQQVEELKNDYQIWSPDLYDHPLKDQIKGVSDALEVLGGGSDVFIIGHDMGGPVACEVARLHPQKVTKVLLINTLSIPQFFGRWKRPAQWFRSLYMPIFMGPLHSTTMWRKLAKPFLENGNTDVLEGIKRYREVAREIPKLKDVPRLAVETHVLFGKEDPFVLTPTMDELLRHFEKADLETLPTGHWPQKDSPSEVNQWIRKKTN